MQTFHLDAISQDRQTLGEAYHEFLRSRDMSAGVYHLQPGAHDSQGAHQEESLYYVINGSASMQVGSDSLEVVAGSIIHVPARVAPRFSTVHSALDVLVVFSPAESAPTVAIRGAV
ncbi:cupin domain-containing protein [Chitinimonas viridis]|uniref:Cupin domain-containing protein n=1 Tax=Chitinimonas viridis TaxID=664880 RepID=A0ABT8B2Z7_9NEIS|nr:cupin domain-containing protein [Chitinimonas viridis]MDN3576375.1 cupin domain-containing protein [Chitinimonas viridis]